ncbi:hypothetical protein JK359_01030 [Streptomyces actinomycinicus]|uniref:Intersectin-EH binding protein Ibp1 n=1 Tax=Streptomyces actinomycinicus TaxID=1695166 RepID=A0A937EEB0_9ACTN|nr:hypothetical protein [Streptomyces actinomycinicus]MBL1080570.1 hypothetical protein [Streptomyces actinomycinicus]
MFSAKKIAAVSGLLGGVVLAGITQAHADPGTCTRDLLGSLTCTQHISGKIPEDGVIPHQENCQPVQPVTLPAALGNGRLRVGPEVTCSQETRGVPETTDGEPESPSF